MDRRSCGKAGFSLLELLICIAVILVISTLATFQFREWSRKASIEKQLKMTFMDLINVRTRALFGKEPLVVRFFPDSYAVFPGTASDRPPVMTKSLPHRITWGGVTDTLDIRYDTLGITDKLISICIDGDERSSVPLDSLVISRTRTRLGKRENGKPCNGVYIK